MDKMAWVAIIGAGPAGIYAAKELAIKGIKVVLFNRDIKPGGLAEYGIYPEKTKLKDGLRFQFHQILLLPGITYFGNTSIGENSPFKLSDLKSLGFSAILVATGAQGSKKLMLPGNDLQGVYHANDIVYHYNHLPPFATQRTIIGKKVVVVGVGNVMTDIVRYLCSCPQVQEITTVARRGLAEIKFDKIELEPIIAHLDWQDFQREVERITPAMQKIGQEPNVQDSIISEEYATAPEKSLLPPWRLRFLYSPVKILGDETGAVSGVEVEENLLQISDQKVVPESTGKFTHLAADTLIFAIGDQVDANLGLKVNDFSFALKDQPRFPINGESFELGDVVANANSEGVFVCGWSRHASKGMVGIAHKDGVNAAKVILAYLAENALATALSINQLEFALKKAGYSYVTLEDIGKLEAAENQANEKFNSNEEMLKAMGLKS